MKQFEYTTEEYQELCDDYCGLCLHCGEIADSTEPDAEEYECDSCGRNQVIGMENALMMGYISLGG